MATRKEPSASPASPAGMTSTNSQRDTLNQRLAKTVPASKVSDVLTMKAQGISSPAVGQALGIAAETVNRIAKEPANQAEILARRAWLKSRTSQRLEALLEPAWDMAHEAALSRDAKSFDATMRGLHAQEKISASISGENQRVQVEHSGSVETNKEPVIVQLQQLIAMVKGDPPGPAKLNP